MRRESVASVSITSASGRSAPAGLARPADRGENVAHRRRGARRAGTATRASPPRPPRRRASWGRRGEGPAGSLVFLPLFLLRLFLRRRRPSRSPAPRPSDSRQRFRRRARAPQDLEFPGRLPLGRRLFLLRLHESGHQRVLAVRQQLRPRRDRRLRLVDAALQHARRASSRRARFPTSRAPRQAASAAAHGLVASAASARRLRDGRRGRRAVSLRVRGAARARREGLHSFPLAMRVGPPPPARPRRRRGRLELEACFASSARLASSRAREASSAFDASSSTAARSRASSASRLSMCASRSRNKRRLKWKSSRRASNALSSPRSRSGATSPPGSAPCASGGSASPISPTPRRVKLLLFKV